MNNSTTFKDKTLMITGGTGSFGNTVLKHFMNTDLAEIRIFSRDEKKQDDMRHRLQEKSPELASKVRFFIGDVRNAQSVRDAMHGVDYIFHAAALKQVPSCEFFPMEAVRTNVIGTDNVLHAAIEEGVTRRVPVHRQGRIPHQRHGQVQGHDGVHHLRQRPQRRRPHHHLLHALRQRHVLARQRHPAVHRPHPERGASHGHRPQHDPLPHEPGRGRDLVQFAFEHANPGDLFIQKAPASTIGDLAEAVQEVFGRVGTQVIGTRHGEKLFETLMTREERLRAEDMGGYYRVACDSRDLNYDKFVVDGEVETQADESYTSHNTERLDVAGTIAKIKTAEYVQLA